ncbi:unnamed protein product [Protopolystoma xenopodis]|uniref:Uncharacterized protein n=1 Tax=Protopolystoma xenopodis TaxID=117903 RepID=A0A3S5ASX6_9PLAT|nr:unnamed protein product [Protopolystoma xenopodis]
MLKKVRTDPLHSLPSEFIRPLCFSSISPITADPCAPQRFAGRIVAAAEIHATGPTVRLSGPRCWTSIRLRTSKHDFGKKSAASESLCLADYDGLAVMRDAMCAFGLVDRSATDRVKAHFLAVPPPTDQLKSCTRVGESGLPRGAMATRYDGLLRLDCRTLIELLVFEQVAKVPSGRARLVPRVGESRGPSEGPRRDSSVHPFICLQFRLSLSVSLSLSHPPSSAQMVATDSRCSVLSPVPSRARNGRVGWRGDLQTLGSPTSWANLTLSGGGDHDKYSFSEGHLAAETTNGMRHLREAGEELASLDPDTP